jgi:xylulokinase
MFMLCYENGSLAGERVRDSLGPCLSSKESAVSTSPNVNPRTKFNDVAISAPPLGRKQPSDPAKLGLYFPLPELVPDLRSGAWRFT